MSDFNKKPRISIIDTGTSNLRSVFYAIKTNNCECNICSRVRICLQGYESYETYDPMVTRFKDSIKTRCKTHKIII